MDENNTTYMKLKTRNQYTFKDQLKADKCNKFIGFGRFGSSTLSYANDYQKMANCGEYLLSDVIFISANGGQKNAEWISNIKLAECEIKIADNKGINKFVTDNKYHRNRQYNIGERYIAELLTELGYTENDGEWTKN